MTTFADAVRAVLEEHGATLRSQRQRTGLAHSTIANWLQGVKPQMEAVITFARGFGKDVNAFLVLAGYDPIEDTRPLGAIIRDRAAGHSYHAEAGATAAGYEGGPSPKTQEALRAAEILLRDEERGIAE